MSGWTDKYAGSGADPYASSSDSMDDPFGDSGENAGLDFVSVGGATTNLYEGLDAPSEPSPRSAGLRYEGAEPHDEDGTSRAGASPRVDPMLLMGVNPATVRAVQKQLQTDTRYLPGKHRSFYETSVHNIGMAYLLLGGIGLSVGFVEGLATAKNYRFRFIVNNVLNKCVARGTKLGNSVGILSLTFTSLIWGLDQLEFDQVAPKLGLTRRDIYTPMAAAGLAGSLFFLPKAVDRRRYPAGRGTMLLAGVLGASSVALLGTVGPMVIGDLSPFSWE